jgi:hypothetical protein
MQVRCITTLSKHSHGMMYSQVEGRRVNDISSIIDYTPLDEWWIGKDLLNTSLEHYLKTNLFSAWYWIRISGFLDLYIVQYSTNTRQHNVSETGSVSVLRSSFQNMFSSVCTHWMMDKVQKHSDSECYTQSSEPLKSKVFSVQVSHQNCSILYESKWFYMYGLSQKRT